MEGREDFEEFHDAKNSPEFSQSLLRRRPAGSVRLTFGSLTFSDPR